MSAAPNGTRHTFTSLIVLATVRVPLGETQGEISSLVPPTRHSGYRFFCLCPSRLQRGISQRPARPPFAGGKITASPVQKKVTTEQYKFFAAE